MLRQYFDRYPPPPLMGASNAGELGTDCDSGQIASYWSMTAAGHVSKNCDGWPYSVLHRRRRISESLFITACSMHERTKRREQNLFVCSGQSKASKLTNNERQHSRYEANYRQTWSITRPVCNSRATCMLPVLPSVQFTVGWAYSTWEHLGCKKSAHSLLMGNWLTSRKYLLNGCFSLCITCVLWLCATLW